MTVRRGRGPAAVRPGPGGRTPGRSGRRRRDADDVRFPLVSPTGAPVVRPSRLDAADRLKALLPSLFTLINLLCGFSSALAAFQGRFGLASLLIAVSVLCDIADGAVARAVGATTPFGLQFDSLADLVSFGTAPAVLLYAHSLHDDGWLGWFLACLWLACAAFRLARFNVTVDPLADKRYFIGLPSPGAAGVVLATVNAAPADGFDGWAGAVPLVACVVPALLMASSVRFRAFRNLVSPGPDQRWLTVAVLVGLAVALLAAPDLTLCAVAYAYVATAPLGWATAPWRRRWLGPASVVAARHRMPSLFFPEPVDEAAGSSVPDRTAVDGAGDAAAAVVDPRG